MMEFVLWVMLWPVSGSLSEYLHFLRTGEKYTETVKSISALVNIVVWVSIAVLIYPGSTK